MGTEGGRRRIFCCVQGWGRMGSREQYGQQGPSLLDQMVSVALGLPVCTVHRGAHSCREEVGGLALLPGGPAALPQAGPSICATPKRGG